MKRLKKEKKKYRFFPILHKYNIIYKKLLKEDQDFNWSFFTFIYRLFIIRNYELNTIDSLHFILLCKIDRLNKEVYIEYNYISEDTISNVYLITALNNSGCLEKKYIAPKPPADHPIIIQSCY